MDAERPQERIRRGSGEERPAERVRRGSGQARGRLPQLTLETCPEQPEVSPAVRPTATAESRPQTYESRPRTYSRSVRYHMRLPTPANENFLVDSPRIDLKLPRLPGGSSAFVVDMNTRLKSKLDLLSPRQSSPQPSRAGEDPARTTASVLEILGSNEEHAQEFNKCFGEIRGQIKHRFAAPDMGGSGLWDGGQQGAPTQPVQPVDVKPTKSPRQAQQERQHKQKEQLKDYQASQNLIRKEVQQRIELVRDDEAYRLDFKKRLAQIIEEQKVAYVRRYGTEDHVATNAARVSEMHSPRGAEARLQHLFAAQHSREDAAHVRVREMREREAQRQHLSRAEKMTKQRLEAQMAARLLHQQAQWRTLLVLSASALTLGQVIEPRREQRKFETAGMLIKVRLKRMMTRKREQKMAQTKSALNAVLWISHLNRQVKAKKQGAGVIAEFLISIAQQSLLPVSARVFM
jgi:hypothetical protein